MATAKKTPAKKVTKKKTSKPAVKKVGLDEQDKRALWLAMTVIIVLIAYFAFTYFA